MTKLDV